MALWDGDAEKERVARGTHQSFVRRLQAAEKISDEKLAIIREQVALQEENSPTWPDESTLHELEREWVWEARHIQEGYELNCFSAEGLKIASENQPAHEVMEGFALRVGYASLRILRLVATVRALRKELEQADMDRETAWAALGRKP